MTREFVEGSKALAGAAITAGCRFFAGYPMTPFTGLLDHLAHMLPEAGGVVVNAESELEAVGMAWGALSTGARAATGSTGPGLSRLQESLPENPYQSAITVRDADGTYAATPPVSGAQGWAYDETAGKFWANSDTASIDENEF